MRIAEHRFRASQICRVLGSPIAHGLTAALLEQGTLTLTELVRLSRRSKTTTCYHLTRLRLAQIVRYENVGAETRYRLKYPDQIRRLLDDLDAFIERAGARLREES